MGKHNKPRLILVSLANLKGSARRAAIEENRMRRDRHRMLVDAAEQERVERGTVEVSLGGTPTGYSFEVRSEGPRWHLKVLSGEPPRRGFAQEVPGYGTTCQWRVRDAVSTYLFPALVMTAQDSPAHWTPTEKRFYQCDSLSWCFPVTNDCAAVTVACWKRQGVPLTEETAMDLPRPGTEMTAGCFMLHQTGEAYLVGSPGQCFYLAPTADLPELLSRVQQAFRTKHALRLLVVRI